MYVCPLCKLVKVVARHVFACRSEKAVFRPRFGFKELCSSKVKLIRAEKGRVDETLFLVLLSTLVSEVKQLKRSAVARNTRDAMIWQDKVQDKPESKAATRPSAG